MFTKRVFLILVITLWVTVPFSGCGVSKDNKIYIPGKVFTYNVYEISPNKDTIPHTINLVVKKAGFSAVFGQTPIEYHYLDIKDGGEALVEKTGITENEKRVSIHPPRFNYMAFAQIAPQPSVNLPPSVGTSREITLEVVKGWDSLNNQNIEQVENVIAIEDIKVAEKEYKNCVVTEGSNVSHIDKLGKYSIKYWFHEEYGFVKMVYTKPDSTVVILEVKEVK